MMYINSNSHKKKNTCPYKPDKGYIDYFIIQSIEMNKKLVNKYECRMLSRSTSFQHVMTIFRRSISSTRTILLALLCTNFSINFVFPQANFSLAKPIARCIESVCIEKFCVARTLSSSQIRWSSQDELWHSIESSEPDAELVSDSSNMYIGTSLFGRWSSGRRTSCWLIQNRHDLHRLTRPKNLIGSCMSLN